MTGIYLTIDDSPSGIFPEMCAYLKSKNIPAVFFARGDLLSLYPTRAIQAIKDGFVIANHSWSHHHASKLGADLAIAEVIKTQAVIDELYKIAGIACPGPFMRFPHMDSGLGGWPLPPEKFALGEQREMKEAYARFYNNSMAEPDATALERHQMIETALSARGFRQMNFAGVEVEWYTRYAASNAVSTQGTFCHPDWMLAARHTDKLPAGDKVAHLNTGFDRFVAAHPGNHILVMHDSVELWPYFQRLIDHMPLLGDAGLQHAEEWLEELRSRYTTPEQHRAALEVIGEVDASGLWPGKVKTELKPVGDFWEAEPEHQDYLERIPHGYTCHFVRPDWVLPKRAAAE